MRVEPVPPKSTFYTAPSQEEGPPAAVGGALGGHIDILSRRSWCEDDQGRSAEDGHYLGEGRVLGGKYKRFFIMLSLPCGTFHRFVLTCHYAFYYVGVSKLVLWKRRVLGGIGGSLV